MRTLTTSSFHLNSYLGPESLHSKKILYFEFKTAMIQRKSGN